jgi:hypothetical protein
MGDLGHWLRRAAPEGGVSLDRLEDDVWSRVKALLIGIANGGLGAKFAQTPSSEMTVLTAAGMSPLARLELG